MNIDKQDERREVGEAEQEHEAGRGNESAAEEAAGERQVGRVPRLADLRGDSRASVVLSLSSSSPRPSRAAPKGPRGKARRAEELVEGGVHVGGGGGGGDGGRVGEPEHDAAAVELERRAGLLRD